MPDDISSRTPPAISPMVDAHWLLAHLADADLRIVDASWHLPNTGRSGYDEYHQQHIPGAIFFDIDKHSSDSPLPHMLPSGVDFAQASSALGIAANHTIVVYDVLGVFSAARVWWMYRHYGAQNVYVLNGGLPAWKAIDGPLSNAPAKHPQTTFDGLESEGRVADASDVLQASKTGDCVILDARSSPRFNGAEKEPREGLRSGHIPGSINMPFLDLLSNGFLKSNDELAAEFQQRSIVLSKPIINSCGSGVTAAVVILALHSLGVENTLLYDGSWSEWGSVPTLPVHSG